MYPAAALTPGRSGRGLVEMAELAEAGVKAFGDCRPAGASAELRWAFEYARPFGLPILAHPLEASLAEEGVMHEGEWSTRLGLPGIPAFAEEIELHRVIRLAAAAGARLHVQQVASEGAAELLRRAKEQGAAVSAEVSPHHLALTDEDLAAYDTALKVEPPLRSRQDRGALIEALEEGVIDCIAAAHTPWTPEEKEAEFTHAPYGAAGLETSLAAVLTELVHTGRMTPLTVCERLTTGPARLFGIEGGTLSPGAPADLILVDPHADGPWIPAGSLRRREAPRLRDGL